MRYDWDETKNSLNERDHDRISLPVGALVFEDPYCLIYPERIDPATGEQRWDAIGAAQLEAGSLVVLCTERKSRMAKKSSASSQPERLKSMNSEDSVNRKCSKAQENTIRRLAARQAAGDDSHINFKEIPPLTEEQLAGVTRLRDRQPKIAVSVRLDARVVEWLKSKGEGHLTRINDILANVMDLEAKR